MLAQPKFKRSQEASGYDFSRAECDSEDVEGIGPCNVETVPAVGQIRSFVFSADVFCHRSNGGRQITPSNESDGGSVD